jgi:hypothetical protein
MSSYTVRIQTEDAGKFLVKVEAGSLKEAEAIACQAVRYQFSHLITSSLVFPSHAF